MDNALSETNQPFEDLDDAYRFGPVLLAEEECPQHFLFVGATGGGKTTAIRLLMQDVVTKIEAGRDTRALIYDPKQEMPSILHGINPDTRVVLLNPFDDRGAAWDICRDVREPRVAIEVAFTLIPQQHESQPFFSDAARHLLYGAMLSFLTRKLDWGLADLVRAVSTPKLLVNVLAASRHTKNLISRYFGDKRLLSNILSTIATKMLPYEPIAACWEAAKERVSLEEWVDSEFVVVLGNSETSRAAINALNRCIFKRASDLHLNQSESWTRRTWWFIDELSEAGKLDGLKGLCKRSRSKGGCVVLAFQSVEGLRDPQLYGRHVTADILGQMGHRFFGRIECPETAEWACKLIGEEEINQTTMSRGWSAQGGASHSHNEQVVTPKTILPSEFMAVPPCNYQDGLTAFYLSRVTGAFWENIPGQQLFDEDVTPKSTTMPDFVPRPIACQFLEPWDKQQSKEFAPKRRRLWRKRNKPDIDQVLDEPMDP